MLPKRVAINGLGRIGRLALRILLKRGGVDIVAVNDLTDAATLAHLLKYDSNQGRFPGEVRHTKDTVIIDGRLIHVYATPLPEQLPWKSLNVDIVLESTGRFLDIDSNSGHLAAGARHIIISAPAKEPIPMVVLGVNEHILQQQHTIISNASCTTNCLAPMAKVLDEHFGIAQGYINTVHAYTADQRLHDAPHKDLRRARAATHSIIPTSTGAASAVGRVLPRLQGKLNGIAMRVPVATGSVVDFTAVLQQCVSREEVNAALQQATHSEALQGIMAYTEDPIVSVDVVGNRHSCLVDSQLTMVQGTLVRVVGWYDNEMGYAHRLADLIEKI
ncbi:MAG: type I glyceraldehyde-3-phosphate dehydrogenase [Bacteroidota bacterium]